MNVESQNPRRTPENAPATSSSNRKNSISHMAISLDNIEKVRHKNSWWTRGAIVVHSWCTPGGLLVDSWCTPGALLVQSWCNRGALVAHSWCTRVAIVVHSWCSRGALVAHSWRIKNHVIFIDHRSAFTIFWSRKFFENFLIENKFSFIKKMI